MLSDWQMHMTAEAEPGQIRGLEFNLNILLWWQGNQILRHYLMCSSLKLNWKIWDSSSETLIGNIHLKQQHKP